MLKVSNWLLILALTMALLLARSYAAPPAISLQEIEASPPDEVTIDYLIPRLAAKYAFESSWRGVLDPSLFVLTEVESTQQDANEALRPKRKLPSLSIVNPMEVLRQRLLLEIARKQMRENNQRQAEENRIFLQNVGKRSKYNDRFRTYGGELDGFQRTAKLKRYFSDSNLLAQTLNDDSANEMA